jgi:hypothetical protein
MNSKIREFEDNTSFLGKGSRFDFNPPLNLVSERGKSGKKAALFERSETERVQPRPGFSERANAPEGRGHRGALSFVSSLGKQRNDKNI